MLLYQKTTTIYHHLKDLSGNISGNIGVTCHVTANRLSR